MSSKAKSIFFRQSLKGDWVTRQSRQCASLSPVVRIGSPHPFTRKRSSGSKGVGNTPACERGGGGSQFGRRDRHSGTLGLVKPLNARWFGSLELCCHEWVDVGLKKGRGRFFWMSRRSNSLNYFIFLAVNPKPTPRDYGMSQFFRLLVGAAGLWFPLAGQMCKFYAAIFDLWSILV